LSTPVFHGIFSKLSFQPPGNLVFSILGLRGGKNVTFCLCVGYDLRSRLPESKLPSNSTENDLYFALPIAFKSHKQMGWVPLHALLSSEELHLHPLEKSAIIK